MATTINITCGKCGASLDPVEAPLGLCNRCEYAGVPVGYQIKVTDRGRFTIKHGHEYLRANYIGKLTFHTRAEAVAYAVDHSKGRV